MKGSHKAALQTNAQLNMNSNLNELYGLGYNYHKDYDQRIDKVTKEDVRNMANRYLDLDKVVTIYVRPPAKE